MHDQLEHATACVAQLSAQVAELTSLLQGTGTAGAAEDSQQQPVLTPLERAQVIMALAAAVQVCMPGRRCRHFARDTTGQANTSTTWLQALYHVHQRTLGLHPDKSPEWVKEEGRLALYDCKVRRTVSISVSVSFLASFASAAEPSLSLPPLSLSLSLSWHSGDSLSRLIGLSKGNTFMHLTARFDATWPGQ